MPNHVENRIAASGPIPVLANYVKTDTDRRGETFLTFDFSQLVPSPPELVQAGVDLGTQMVAEIALGLFNLSSALHPGPMPRDPLADGASMSRAADLLHARSQLERLTQGPMAKDLTDEQFESLVAMMKSYRACGALTWYDWNRRNWGTKWNAYQVAWVDEPSVLGFQTAWAPPHPVIAALAAAHPDIEFVHEWADEDTGNNVGTALYAGGDRDEFAELSGTKAGYELAFKLHDCASDYRWDGTKYVYIDDQDDDE